MVETLIPELGSLPHDTVVYLHDGSFHGRSLLAVGEAHSIRFQSNTQLKAIDHFLEQHKDEWKVALFGYNLKNSIEDLSSKHPENTDIPESLILVPQMLFSIERGNIEVISGHSNPQLSEVLKSILEPSDSFTQEAVELYPRLTREDYLEDLGKVQQHIQRGDIYEMNYCQEFFNESADIQPFETYKKLHYLTRAPFSVFIRTNASHLLCGSPERYLKRIGDQLISQPIKGTTRRGNTPEEDELLKEALRADEKERGENIMITDLVRNDLGRIAQPNSVNVDELCEIYSFETVHQMISTVSALAKKELKFSELLQATFPMGSMTGAPKVRSMQLIDEIERSDRGLYSGSVGYIEPNGNFDFNVVIRSLLYNSESHYLSARVGGAITALSDPEKEYEECLLKADALFKALR